MEVLFATNNPAKVKIYANKLEENGKTLAELSDDEKNKISARKIALEKIKKKL